MHSNLLFELEFWHIFIGSSLRPSSHRAEPKMEAIELLYCMKHGHNIDIDEYIHPLICLARSLKTKKLTIPCLITHLCSVVGIHVAVGNVGIPIGLVNRNTYNRMENSNGMPLLMNENNQKGLWVQVAAKGAGSDQVDAGDTYPGIPLDVHRQEPTWVVAMFTTLQEQMVALSHSLYIGMTRLQEQLTKIQRLMSV